VIDPNRFYVYLKFDHIGKGIQRSPDEPNSRIWFLFANNCRVPIVVSTFGVPDGALSDEQGVMDDVVANALVGPIFHPGSKPSAALTQNSATKKQKSEANLGVAEMPRGYMFEVGSSQSIPPGGAILFSVPVNHVGKRWHFEIPYTFDLPSGKGFRDPMVGGEPKMVVTYSMSDLPPKAAAEVELLSKKR